MKKNQRCTSLNWQFNFSPHSKRMWFKCFSCFDLFVCCEFLCEKQANKNGRITREKKKRLPSVFVVGFFSYWESGASTGNEKTKESMPQCYNLPATMKCGRLQMSSYRIVCHVALFCVFGLFKLAPKLIFRALPTFCSPMEPYVLVK